MGAGLKRILPALGAGAAILLVLPALLLTGCPNPLLDIVKREVANAGGQPEIQLSKGGVIIASGGATDVGTCEVSPATKAITFAIENTGGASLVLDGAPVIASGDTGSFVIGTPPFSVIGGHQNSTFTLEFSPTSAAAKTITLEVSSNDADEAVYTITVTGTGVSAPGPEMQVTQDSTDIDLTNAYAFPPILAGTSEDIVFTIRNIGTPGTSLGLSVNPVSITGGGGAFTIVSQPGTLIPEGTGSDFTLRFSPTAGVGADYNATVSIGATTDVDEDPYVFTISGSGRVPNIEVRQGATVMSSGAYTEAFGDVPADGNNEQASAAVTYTLYNTGQWPLSLTGITIAGTNPADFDLNNTTSSPVAPGANTSFTVRFDPLTRAAGRQATVTIVSSDPDTASFSFTVSGNGVFAPKVYWVNRYANAIVKANLNGTNPETVLSGLSDPVGLAIDPTNDLMYWAEYGGSRIMRANLDGSAQTVLVGSQGGAFAVALDPSNGWIFWSVAGTARLGRANLADGSGVTTVPCSAPPYGVAVDPASNTLYWANINAKRLQQGPMDPLGAGTVWFPSLSGAGQHGLAIDLDSGYLYWSERDAGIICRTPLPGYAPEVVYSGAGAPTFLALDVPGGMIYWTQPLANSVWRAKLDGSDPQQIAGGQPYAFGIALELMP